MPKPFMLNYSLIPEETRSCILRTAFVTFAPSTATDGVGRLGQEEEEEEEEGEECGSSTKM